MDTGTHLVMGVTLGGLASIDPIVAANPELSETVFWTCVIASQIPDIDTLLKSRGNATYIRNHRGYTHSVYAQVLWPTVITALAVLLVGSMYWFHIWLWAFIAIMIHVITDSFNGYGTQILRPFSKKWVAIGAVHTFDSYVFAIHFLAIVCGVFFQFHISIFIFAYLLTILHFIRRTFVCKNIHALILSIFPKAEPIIISSTIRQGQYKIAFAVNDLLYVARYTKEGLHIVDKIEKRDSFMEIHEQQIKEDPNIAAFLAFSPIYHHEIIQHKDYTEIRLMDLRYRNHSRYTFVAVAHIDPLGNIISSYTGWFFNEKTLQNKLNLAK